MNKNIIFVKFLRIENISDNICFFLNFEAVFSQSDPAFFNFYISLKQFKTH